ncbi:MAG: class I SAM-dependent methyltransferase [Candidatus Hydrothermarchaeales archaeon]
MRKRAIHRHFTRVAQQYRDLRTTDPEPPLYIKKKLTGSKKIEAADVGCGDGRYNLELFKCLGDRLNLSCIDANPDMLKQLHSYLAYHKIENFQTKKAYAENLPIEESSLDCIFTFNAIHHFDLTGFLEEASRVLKDNGHLFVYTRLKNQNSRNIWGKHFPKFSQKETRLYEMKELNEQIEKAPDLKLQNLEQFKYRRISNIERLVQQAENHHYSTFSLYNREELKDSIEQFRQNIKQEFNGQKDISWFDENIMLVMRKQTS